MPTAGPSNSDRESFLSFFFLRDIDIYDFIIGFVSGVFRRDDSHLWGECIETIPSMVLASLNVYGGFKFEDPESVFNNIADNIEDLDHWGSLAVAIGTKVVKIISVAQNCINFVDDI